MDAKTILVLLAFCELVISIFCSSAPATFAWTIWSQNTNRQRNPLILGVEFFNLGNLISRFLDKEELRESNINRIWKKVEKGKVKAIG